MQYYSSLSPLNCPEHSYLRTSFFHGATIAFWGGCCCHWSVAKLCLTLCDPMDKAQFHYCKSRNVQKSFCYALEQLGLRRQDSISVGWRLIQQTYVTEVFCFLAELYQYLPLNSLCLDPGKGQGLKSAFSAEEWELYFVDTLQEHFSRAENFSVEFSIYSLFDLGR